MDLHYAPQEISNFTYMSYLVLNLPPTPLLTLNLSFTLDELYSLYSVLLHLF